MLMILVQHADFWALGQPQEHTLRAYGACVIEAASIIAVNVFVLISGYFGIKFKGIKILNLLFQCFFAVIPLSIVFLIWNYNRVISDYSFYELFQPFRYWFVSAYIGLIIISPVLNLVIERFEKKELVILILLVSIAAFIFDTLLREDMGFAFYGGYSTLWMANLYLIGRFIRLYPLNKISTKMAVSLFFCYIVVQGTLLFFHLIGTRYTNPLLLVASIAFFLIFIRLKFSNKRVNWIASSALMVYLFSMHPVVIGIYGECLHDFCISYTMPLFLLLTIILISAIFVVAIFYDKVRMMVWRWVEPMCNKLVRIVYTQIEKFYFYIEKIC